MPIYEYEPEDHECLICNGRVEVMQSVQDEPLKYCPTCGLEVRRVISRAAFKMSKSVDPDRAASRGFTTFRKLESGKWEKVAGEGPDQIERPKADDPAPAEPPKKVIDLD